MHVQPHHHGDETFTMTSPATFFPRSFLTRLSLKWRAKTHELNFHLLREHEYTGALNEIKDAIN